MAMVYLVDAQGRLIVVPASPSGVQPTEQNTVFSNLNLPSGNSTQYGLTVPAGQVYRITMFAVQYTGTVAGVTLLSLITKGASPLYFQNVNPVVSGVVYPIVIDLLLSGGDKIGVAVFGATLNDDLNEYIFAQRVT